MRSALPTAVLLAALAPELLAGGSGESAFLVVDPSSAEALYVANVYRDRRDLPFPNALYMEPGAPDYAAFVAAQGAAFLGALEARGVEDHVDYVVLAPTNSFFVPAPGVVNDSCFPVNRIALASAYTLARRGEALLQGTASSSANYYAGSDWNPVPFDSSLSWLGGEPTDSILGRRYFMGALLGWTGQNGNTLEEVLDLVERSVASDATQPAGTYYFMQTDDFARSSPRDPFYPGAVSQITGDGGMAEHLFADLPLGHHDCLGIMTGLANPDIDGADLTILPGAFADHLTSFAGTFDNGSQTKMSRWIAKGACATSGTVEEPCNYPGKFPHARLHVLASRGLTLGEAWLRSMAWEPFQNLFLGDPLARPFAHALSVDVAGLPAGPAAGPLTLTPSGTSSAPGASLASFELLVDGVLAAAAAPGEDLALDTTTLADGWHELRVLAVDDAPEANKESWKGELVVDNAGLGVALQATPRSGDLSQRFDLTLAASGGAVEEILVRQGGRVVASASGGGTVAVHGQNLGAGPVRLVAEARFAGGFARSAPVDLDVAYDPGAPAAVAPTAHGHRVVVPSNCAPFVVELPGSYPTDPGAAAHVVLQEPAQATRLDAGTAPYAIFAPDEAASGADTLTFRVDTAGGSSAAATVEIVYLDGDCGPPPPVIDAVVPATIASVVPGKEQTVTLTGSGFFGVTEASVAGVPLGGFPSSFTVVNDSTITLAMPTVASLGAAPIEVGGPHGTATIAIEVVPADPPALELGDGDDPETLTSFLPLELAHGGQPGEVAVIFASLDPTPSFLPGLWDLEIGGDNANLVLLDAGVIAPSGHYDLSFVPKLPPATTVYFQSASYEPGVLPLTAANVVSGLFLF